MQEAYDAGVPEIDSGVREPGGVVLSHGIVRTVATTRMVYFETEGIFRRRQFLLFAPDWPAERDDELPPWAAKRLRGPWYAARPLP